VLSYYHHSRARSTGLSKAMFGNQHYRIRPKSLNGLNLGNLTARAFTGTEAAEIAADKAEKSIRVPDIEPLYGSSSENSESEVMVPATPRGLSTRPNSPESLGGVTTIILALRAPEWLRLGPDPRASPARESEPTWQLPASTAPQA
jgi:hypothetical protein